MWTVECLFLTAHGNFIRVTYKLVHCLRQFITGTDNMNLKVSCEKQCRTIDEIRMCFGLCRNKYILCIQNCNAQIARLERFSLLFLFPFPLIVSCGQLFECQFKNFLRSVLEFYRNAGDYCNKYLTCTIHWTTIGAPYSSTIQMLGNSSTTIATGCILFYWDITNDCEKHFMVLLLKTLDWMRIIFNKWDT